LVFHKNGFVPLRGISHSETDHSLTSRAPDQLYFQERFFKISINFLFDFFFCQIINLVSYFKGARDLLKNKIFFCASSLNLYVSKI